MCARFCMRYSSLAGRAASAAPGPRWPPAFRSGWPRLRQRGRRRSGSGQARSKVKQHARFESVFWRDDVLTAPTGMVLLSLGTAAMLFTLPRVGQVISRVHAGYLFLSRNVSRIAKHVLVEGNAQPGNRLSKSTAWMRVMQLLRLRPLHWSDPGSHGEIRRFGIWPDGAVERFRVAQGQHSNKRWSNRSCLDACAIFRWGAGEFFFCLYPKRGTTCRSRRKQRGRALVWTPRPI